MQNTQNADEMKPSGLSYASRLKPKAEKGGGMGGREMHDESKEVAFKITELVELLKASKNCVVLTGAGISTSAGVADFRGPNGVWTAEKKGLPPPKCISFDQANPTLTHMALVGLERAGIVKLVISQNVDGLHLRSGLPRERLAELHGNLFLETCEVCGSEYLRDFDVGGISFSRTGRFCTRTGCGGALRDTLLDWDDALPEADLYKAETALSDCDLCICMGTSLRIRPASELPLIAVRAGGKLVICNLQNTPKDRHATLNIHASVDQVMSGVMALLGLQIPNFRREVELLARAHQIADGSDVVQVSMCGIAGETCALGVVESCAVEYGQVKHESVPGPPWKASLPKSLGEIRFIFAFTGQAGQNYRDSVAVNVEELCEGKKEMECKARGVEVAYEVQGRDAAALAHSLRGDAQAWSATAHLRAAAHTQAASSAGESEGGKGSRKRRGGGGGVWDEAGGPGWVQCENKGCRRWGRPRPCHGARHASAPADAAAGAAATPFYCRRRCATEAQAFAVSELQGQDTSAPGDTSLCTDTSAPAVKEEHVQLHPAGARSRQVPVQ